MTTKTNGNYGCILSHLKAIEYAKQLDLDYAIIFEDDVLLCDDYLNRLKYIENCNLDFDMFYLGGFFNGRTDIPIKTNKKYIHNLISAAGTHAYIISKSIYDYVLNKLASDFWSLLGMEWVDSGEFGR